MTEKYRKLKVPKRDALRIYRKYALMQEHSQIPEGLPHSAEVRSWRDATVQETLRRISELEAIPDETVEVELIYDYPRDVVNFYNRLAGDPEE